MTLVGSANILMSARHKRWLSCKEMLGAQGFPVSTEHTYGVPCSSYSKRAWQAERGEDAATWPSRRAICLQAGNSMHTAVSGLVLLFCMTQISLDPGTVKAQQYVLRRHLNVQGLLEHFSPKATQTTSP